MNTKTLRFFSWITLAFLPINTVFAVPAGQITQASGYVAVSSPQTAPKSVGNGTPIESGQVVTLGKDSSAVIKFQDGQIIALQSKSIFKVNSYKYDQAAPQKGESFFSLLQGGLRAITGLIGNNNREGWKLATPTMTIGIRGTDFMSVVNVNRGVFVKVDAGAISATNSAGTAVFTAGQTGSIASATVLGTTVPAASIPAGTFSELSAINISAVGGSAVGSTAAASSTVLGVPTAVVVGVGVAGAAAAAASNGSSTTSHH